jgi:hypothetical protein
LPPIEIDDGGRAAAHGEEERVTTMLALFVDIEGVTV